MPTTIELLKKQIEEIERLKSLPSSESPAFKQWEQVTMAIIKKRLGQEKLDDFPSSFEFLPSTIGPWEDYELKESLLKGLEVVESYLNGLIREIEILGEEDSFNNEGPSSHIHPKLNFGESGNNGRAGSGGSVFIQAKNFTMGDGGKISAGGGDYITHSNELNNFGTIDQTIAETVNNISHLSRVVSQSELKEAEKRQLIGDIETIKAQIIKPNPDKSILQRSWDAVQVASTIGGAIQLLKMIEPVVTALLT